jgi:phosphoesterase RecJ-like protein
MTVLIERQIWDEARKLIDAARSPLVLAHKRPDVDAISSMTILGSVFAMLGKSAHLVTERVLPEYLYFIPGHEAISSHLPSVYDLVVCVDTSDAGNLGIPGGQTLAPDVPVLVIDHHSSNTRFGVCNVIAAQAVSTTDMLYEALMYWSLPISASMAKRLLAGMMTDTHTFRLGAIDQRVFTQVIALMNLGGDYASLQIQLDEGSPLNELKLFGLALSRAQFDAGVLWTWLELEDFSTYDLPAINTIHAAPVLVREKNVKVAAEFSATGAGSVRLSVHARPGIDVSKLAMRHGGGGHATAAGCTLADQNAWNAAQRLLPELKKVVSEGTWNP